MAAKWSGRARIAGMARSYKELLHSTGDGETAIKKAKLLGFARFPFPVPCRYDLSACAAPA